MIFTEIVQIYFRDFCQNYGLVTVYAVLLFEKDFESDLVTWLKNEDVYSIRYTEYICKADSEDYLELEQPKYYYYR